MQRGEATLRFFHPPRLEFRGLMAWFCDAGSPGATMEHDPPRFARGSDTRRPIWGPLAGGFRRFQSRTLPALHHGQLISFATAPEVFFAPFTTVFRKFDRSGSIAIAALKGGDFSSMLTTRPSAR